MGELVKCEICGRPAEMRKDGLYLKICWRCRERQENEKRRKDKGHKDFGGKMTLCWSCKNAVPDFKKGYGCSWSNYFKPVEGWKATETEVSVQNKKKRSYIVIECPLYRADEEEED